MKKFIVVMAILAMAGVAQAGSYTITTTAEQDASLSTLASDAGVSAQQLIDAKFSVYLQSALQKKASMKARRIQRIVSDMSLSDAEKTAQVNAIMVE